MLHHIATALAFLRSCRTWMRPSDWEMRCRSAHRAENWLHVPRGARRPPAAVLSGGVLPAALPCLPIEATSIAHLVKVMHDHCPAGLQHRTPAGGSWQTTLPLPGGCGAVSRRHRPLPGSGCQVPCSQERLTGCRCDLAPSQARQTPASIAIAASAAAAAAASGGTPNCARPAAPLLPNPDSQRRQMAHLLHLPLAPGRDIVLQHEKPMQGLPSAIAAGGTRHGDMLQQVGSWRHTGRQKAFKVNGRESSPSPGLADKKLVHCYVRIKQNK